MGFKIDSSPVDVRLSKMEATIEHITSLAAISNIVVNQLMEHEAAVVVITKVASAKEPTWTTVIAKNVRHMVSQAVETLANAPKLEECKLNLRLTGFEAKEDDIEKELVQWLNTKLLEGQIRLHAKVVVATRQWPATTWAST